MGQPQRRPKARKSRSGRVARDGNARRRSSRIVTPRRAKTQAAMNRQHPTAMTTPPVRAAKRTKRHPRPFRSLYLRRHLTMTAMILPTTNWRPDPWRTKQTINQMTRIPMDRAPSHHNAALDGGSAFCPNPGRSCLTNPASSHSLFNQ